MKGFDTGEAGSAAGNIVGGIAGQADIIESCYTDTSIGDSGNKGAIAGIVCTLTDCCAESDSPLCGTINRLPALMTDAAFGKFCAGFGDETDVCEKFKAFYSEIDLDAPEQNYLKLPSPSGKASGISPDGVRSVYSLYNFGSADELKTAASSTEVPPDRRSRFSTKSWSSTSPQKKPESCSSARAASSA